MIDFFGRKSKQLFVCHMIYTPFHLHFAFQDRDTPECHDLGGLIICHIGFPDFSRFEVFFLTIQFECLFIDLVFFMVYISIADIRNKLIDRNSESFSLHCYTIELATEKMFLHREIGGFGDDDTSGVFFGGGFQPGGEIHRISENRVVKTIVRTDITHENFPTRDPDTKIDRGESMCDEFLIEPWKHRTHRESGTTRTYRMIRLRKWRSEKSHHRIADIFIQRSSVLYEDIRHPRKVSRHERKKIFWIELLRYRGKSCNIRKKD